MMRRAVVGAAFALPAAAQPAPIGTARMEPDGTIILDLIARAGGATGHARIAYPPGHPDHAMVLRHLGGLRPGEVKPVAPFP